MFIYFEFSMQKEAKFMRGFLIYVVYLTTRRLLKKYYKEGILAFNLLPMFLF